MVDRRDARYWRAERPAIWSLNWILIAAVATNVCVWLLLFYAVVTIKNKLSYCGYQRSRIASCACSRKGASRKSMMRRLPVRISAFTAMPGRSGAAWPSTLKSLDSMAMCTV